LAAVRNLNTAVNGPLPANDAALMRTNNPFVVGKF
jgi:hypothetical protein